MAWSVFGLLLAGCLVLASSQEDTPRETAGAVLTVGALMTLLVWGIFAGEMG